MLVMVYRVQSYCQYLGIKHKCVVQPLIHSRVSTDWKF